MSQEDRPREVDLYYDTGDVFLDSFADRDGRGEFFVPAPIGEEAPDVGKVGATVAANLHFADRGVTFRVLARLAWRRARGTKRLPAGLGLTIVDEETGRLQKLLAVAKGQEVGWYDRRAPRYVFRLALKVEQDATAILEGTQEVDLSVTGIRVALQRPPVAGTRVAVTLPSASRFGFRGLRIEGQVAWTGRQGEAAGMGIEFAHDDVSRAELARLLVKLRKEQGDTAVSMDGQTSE